MLTQEQVLQLINKGVPDWVHCARKESRRLNVHINGIGTDKYIEKIEKIENEDQKELRKKWLTTNRHVFINLSRPIDKVFSAKGGGRIYNLTQQVKEDQLKGVLSNLRHGKSIRQWIKDIQANKYYTDPAGLVFFEWKDGKTWPVIKTINQIFNYKTDGREPEWVIFEPYKKENDTKDYYRVVDEVYDYLYAKEGDNITLIKDETFKNPFGKVPAIVNSDIINCTLTCAESPFEDVISLADHYLRTGTIKNIVEFLHGYPVFWRYLTPCPVCKGIGYVSNQDGTEDKKCAACNGTGVNLKKDITEVIQLKTPEEGSTVKLAPDVAGYVTPPVESWQELRSEQSFIKELMELTMWGSRMVKDQSNETATAAFLNVQPVNDRLNSFADAFEDMERKMTNLIGTFLFKTYTGASISYGRRFLVESPDTIWKKYSQARKDGSPKVTLDYLLMQFYQSEYANDIESLTIAQKGVLLEPFVHLADKDVLDLGINDQDLKRKLYFNEWFKTIQQQDILQKSVDELKTLFETFLNNIQYERSKTPGIQGNV